MIFPASFAAVLVVHTGTRKTSSSVRAVALSAAIAALAFFLVVSLGVSILVPDHLKDMPSYFFSFALYSVALGGLPITVFVLMGALGVALVLVRRGRKPAEEGRYP